VLELREYVDRDGRSPFGRWFSRLNSPAAAKITTALIRLGEGNLSRVKSVGSGVLEYRIDFGPGYRVYFGRDGNRLVILLAGGTKKNQPDDIGAAQRNWQITSIEGDEAEYAIKS